jgi:hypothetical protein
MNPLDDLIGGQRVEVSEITTPDGQHGYLVIPIEDHTIALHPDDPGPVLPEDAYGFHE